MTNAGSSLNSTLSSMREILSDRSTGRNASPRGVANLERVTGQPEANCRYQASLQLAYRLLSPEPFWLVCTPPKFTRVYGADIVMESVTLTENRTFGQGSKSANAIFSQRSSKFTARDWVSTECLRFLTHPDEGGLHRLRPFALRSSRSSSHTRTEKRPSKTVYPTAPKS